MRCSGKTWVVLAACAAGMTMPSYAADPIIPTFPLPREVRTSQKVVVSPTHRASKLVGMNVRNSEGEKLGAVEDLVINLESGKVAYVAMGYGGVLGFGEKLFAIPFAEFKMDHGNNETYLVLNMTKEKFNAAPGFNKSQWPDFADPNWSQTIDKYYQAQRDGRTESIKTGTKATP